MFFGKLSLKAEREDRSFGDCEDLSGAGASESRNRFVIGGKQQCNPYEDQEGAPSVKTLTEAIPEQGTTDTPETGW